MSPSFHLKECLKRKLWFVTGKGGVGKTTLAVALGLLSARHGLQTLIVETHGLHHVGELFSLEKQPGYGGKRIHKNLSLLQITPEEALEEYVVQQIKFRFLYNAVFNNQYVRHFIDAAPGLVELLTIGKIWSLAKEGKKWGMGRDYDLVIVDAPSTGHGLSLLTVPEVVSQAVRLGPLKSKSDKILQFLRSETESLLWLTTLPEEMPVNEAVEMAKVLEQKSLMPLGPILMNRLWPDLMSPSSLEVFRKNGGSFPLVEQYSQSFELSRFYLQKAKTLLEGHPLIELPLIYRSAVPLEIAQDLSRHLEAALV